MRQAPSRHVKKEFAIDVIVMPDDDDAWQQLRDSFAATAFTSLTRFDAVDGTRLSHETLVECLTPRAAYELSTGRRFPFGWVHEGIPSLGAVGCYLSHLELWKRATERSVPTLILEQDAAPAVSSDQIQSAIAQIPQGADVAFLGHLALFKPALMEVFSSKPPQGFHPVQPTSDIFCTHAYLVTPRGARKLSERALPINAQVDAFLRFLCTPESGLSMVYHTPSLIRQRSNVVSAIQARGATVDNVLQGSMMATRAAANGMRGLLSRAWLFVSKRGRL